MIIIIDEASAKLASFFYHDEIAAKAESVDNSIKTFRWGILGTATETVAGHNRIIEISVSKETRQTDLADFVKKLLTGRKIDKSDCIWIVSDEKQRKCAEVLGIAAIGEPDCGTRYAIESISEIDMEYLERVHSRYNNIPWIIGCTDRCVIRELSLDDLPALYELYAKPGMTEFVEPLYEPEKELEYEKAYIECMYGFYEYGMWLVFSKETGELIGRAGLEHRDYGDETELEMGYLIAPEYQRQGYATEICGFIIDYAKENTSFERINCLIDHDNAASIGLVKKLGFEYVGQSDASGKWLDRYIVSISH